MTDFALPTFLKEIPDWLKFPELRFINRYDWIPFVMLGGACYALGEWSFFSTLTGMNGLMTLTWGFIIPTILLYHATFAVNSLTHIWGKQRVLKRVTKAVTILWLHFLLLAKAGTTTIIFSPDLHAKVFLRANTILHTMVLS